MPNLSDAFVRRMHDVYGAKGWMWIAQLPALIAEYEDRWQLSWVTPLPELSYNFVASAVRHDGTNAILKLGVPNPGFTCEIAALEHFHGHGAVAVLEADAEHEAFLLERLYPGETIAALDNVRAAHLAADVIQRLWKPYRGSTLFPTIARWASGLNRLRTHFGGQTGPLPEYLVEKAEAFFQDLLESMEQPVLLHGDLHHENILSHGAEWVVIDPQGLIGEPAYETARFLHNPIPGFLAMPHLHDVLLRRIEIFHERLGFNQTRMLAWGFCDVMLGAWWSIEDHCEDDVDYFILSLTVEPLQCPCPILGTPV